MQDFEQYIKQKANINGDITIKEVNEMLDAYYENKKMKL